MKCELGKVITFVNGRAYKQEEMLDGGKYKILRVGNFYTNDSWYYSDLELPDNKYIDNGDLIYTWSAYLEWRKSNLSLSYLESCTV